MKNGRRGFSLVELMVGLSVGLVVIGAVGVTFNRINNGIRNANRSNDLSQTVRGVFQLMGADFAAAGRGISDLNAFQIHYNLVENAAAAEPFFYPVSEVGRDGDFSTITLQWFDYDPLNDPTFIISDITAGGSITSMELWTNDPADPQFADIAEGDIFLLYKPELNHSYDTHRDLHSSYSDDDFTWNEDALQNGAVIVQATAVGNVAGNNVTLTISNLRFGNSPTMPTHDITGFDELDSIETMVNDIVDLTWRIRAPDSVWVARRLSDRNGFHRVNYSVREGTLIRTEEGGQDDEPMVLATNVTAFDISVGTDISDPATENTETDWNGAVSTTESGKWIADQGSATGDYPGTQAGRINVIGRHAMAVRVGVTVRSMVADTQNTGLEGNETNYKSRSFDQLFKLRNMHRPVPNH